MKITLSHSGKQHSYHVAKALYDFGLLDVFYTSSYIRNAKMQNYLMRKGNTYWTRRFIEGLSGDAVNSNWRFELKEIIYRKMYGKSSLTQEAVYKRDMNFDAYVARELKKRKSEVFWGFQGSCYESLQSAKQSGKIAVCELATAHITEAKRILGEEANLHPEWADSIDNLVFKPEYENRLCREPHIADFAIAASQFTKQSLLNDGVAEKKIIVLPLGFDIAHIQFVEQSDDIEARPLKLLYAGTVTQRKGIKYLLEAMTCLNSINAELHIIGGIQGSGKALDAYKRHFTYKPAVSQFELFKLYSQYDALVLPTVFEGFGLVIVEAMAAGLPVITTPNSIGTELISNNLNGYIVPIRNTKAIVDSIVELRSKNKHEYLQMRREARKSAEKFSWNVYSERLKTIVNVFK